MGFTISFQLKKSTVSKQGWDSPFLSIKKYPLFLHSKREWDSPFLSIKIIFGDI
jgi:hypothetical protein